MHSSGPVGRHRQLVLVLEGELYLIPFALLKGSSSNEYLYERFSLIAVPSIQGLGISSKVRILGFYLNAITYFIAVTTTVKPLLHSIIVIIGLSQCVLRVILGGRGRLPVGACPWQLWWVTLVCRPL